MRLTLRSRVVAGLVDAGLASLASFATGLYVVNAWAQEPAKIGVYALFFAAMGMATTLTTQWVCIPVEKAVLDLPERVRRGLATTIAFKLAPVALIGGAMVLAPAVWSFVRGGYVDLIVPLASTAFVAYLFSPLQDHLRRLLHMDGASWMAAAVSMVQLVAACLALLVLDVLVGDPAWAAFGALGFANVTSLTVGLLHARASGRAGDLAAVAAFMDSMRLSTLSQAGRWLGTAGVLSTATNFIVSAIITAIAGEAPLGYAEAARTIAQPIVVVSMGLRAIFGPNSMQSAKTRDRAGALRISNLFMLVLWPMTIVYAVLFGFELGINPLVDVAPAAYVVGGLVTVTVLANGLNGASFPVRLELVGANRERALFSTDTLSNVFMLASSTVVAVMGAQVLALAAMARPIGMAVLGIARWGLYRLAIRTHYADADAQRPVVNA